ncbi:MAG: hypothetical protein SNJ71_00300 [Bacteroidales bacterium]
MSSLRSEYLRRLIDSISYANINRKPVISSEIVTLDWKLSPNTNNGIFYKNVERPGSYFIFITENFGDFDPTGLLTISDGENNFIVTLTELAGMLVNNIQVFKENIAINYKPRSLSFSGGIVGISLEFITLQFI